MHRYFAFLFATLIAAASAVAGERADTWSDWSIDVDTARALRGDPIELGANGGAIGDRVLIDITRTTDNTPATLTLHCAAERFSVATTGAHLLAHQAPVSDWPLAASLLATYCARIHGLPNADRIVAII